MRNFFKIQIVMVIAVFLFAGSVFATPSITSISDGQMDLQSEWSGYYADGEETNADNLGVYLDPGYGGQSFDVEYIGLYVSGTSLFFGIQTGFDLVNGEVANGYTYSPGDIFFDLNADDTWDLALDFFISEYGDVTYSVYDEFTTMDPIYPQHNEATPYQIDTHGDSIGTASGEYFNNLIVSNYNSIEGYLDLSALGITHLLGSSAIIHWTMECGNDYLDFKTDAAPVPEPATMLLLGTGLIGLAGIGRKKMVK